MKLNNNSDLIAGSQPSATNETASIENSDAAAGKKQCRFCANYLVIPLYEGQLNCCYFSWGWNTPSTKVYTEPMQISCIFNGKPNTITPSLFVIKKQSGECEYFRSKKQY